MGSPAPCGIYTPNRDLAENYTPEIDFSTVAVQDPCHALSVEISCHTLYLDIVAKYSEIS